MTSPRDSQPCDDSQELASAHLRREVESLYDDYHERWRTSGENELFVEIAEAFSPSVGNLSINSELLHRILQLHEEVGTPGDLSDIPGFVQALTGKSQV